MSIVVNLKIKLKQEILHIETNLMYIPRALFSRLFLQSAASFFLFIVGRLVTLPCEISVQFPVICVNSVRGQSMVCVK